MANSTAWDINKVNWWCTWKWVTNDQIGCHALGREGHRWCQPWLLTYLASGRHRVQEAGSSSRPARADAMGIKHVHLNRRVGAQAGMLILQIKQQISSSL
jgi:hypothetical protein